MDEIKTRQIVMVELKKLKLNTKNPRKNDEAVDTIAKSIEKYGFNVPLFCDTSLTVYCGNTRLKAARKLKMKAVPCIIADDLTPEEIREYALVDNKSAELAGWDNELLQDELSELDLTDFGFEDWMTVGDITQQDNDEEYERKKQEFAERMKAGELSEDSEEYQEFLAKFEAKKTTDDCYTPPLVYEAVADYVAEQYGIDKGNFVRPFVPKGDYQAEKYKPTDIVVDNPPFSIMSEILKFYHDNGIKFFLFAPHLTIFSGATKNCASCIICGVPVTYENGACVSTSFVTNLEDCAFRSSPKLYKAIKQANDENLKQMHVELPKYSYPLYVISSAMLSGFSKYGIEFKVDKDECAFIRQLDSQKETKSAIYGSGYLISEDKKAEREKAEREKAEREKATVWTLSKREIDIIKSLGKR